MKFTEGGRSVLDELAPSNHVDHRELGSMRPVGVVAA